MPIEITTSNQPPNYTPLFDPRNNPGISLHYQSGVDRRLYVGVRRTGEPKWFFINPKTTTTDAGNSLTKTPEQFQIYVSASNQRPNFLPFYGVREGKAIQYHVVYNPDGTYEICLNLNNKLQDGQSLVDAWAVAGSLGTVDLSNPNSPQLNFHQGWVCNGGSCQFVNNGATYATQAQCEAARVPIYGDPPFTGGQCQDRSYIVTLSGTAFGSSGISTRSGPGPVQGIEFVDQGLNVWLIGVRFSNGVQLSGGGIATTSTAERTSWSIVSIVPENGQPDDCGNPLGPIIGYQCP